MPLLDEAPGPRPRDLPDPVDERPSTMKRRARRLLHQAAKMAYASTLGDRQRAERERMLKEVQRLLDEREQKQKDFARAVTHPASLHTAAASGAQPGEPVEAFPRAVRRTLLELGINEDMADKIVRVEGEKGKGKGDQGGGKQGKGKRWGAHAWHVGASTPSSRAAMYQ